MDKKNTITNTVIWAASIALTMLALIFFIDFIPLDDLLSRKVPVTKIYYADHISPAHQELIERFNAHYQGKIEVIPVNLPFSKFSTNERKEILARSLRSKTDCIDIFAVDQIWTPRFARWAYPLDAYIDETARSQINQYALESCYYNNQLVATPLYVDIGVMYYRRDVLNQLPDFAELEQKILQSLTWTEFVNLGKRLRKSNKPFYVFPADNFEGLMCSFHEMLDSPKKNLFIGDSLNLNVPEIRKAINLMFDLINNHNLTPAAVTDFDDYDSYIYALENDALFARGWPGFKKHYKYAIEDTLKIENFQIAPLPHFAWQQKFAVFGGWNLMISKNTNHKNACLLFLKFAMREDIQKMLFEKGSYLTINNKIYQDTSFVKNHGELKYFQRMFEYGKHRPRRLDYTKLSDILSYYINSALKKEISIEEALQIATKKINSNQTFIK